MLDKTTVSALREECGVRVVKIDFVEAPDNPEDIDEIPPLNGWDEVQALEADGWHQSDLIKHTDYYYVCMRKDTST